MNSIFCPPRWLIAAFFLLGTLSAGAGFAEVRKFESGDVFDLEWAEDPRISPDGERVIYIRKSMDKTADRRRGALWIIGRDGQSHRPVTDTGTTAWSPRWSPDGGRLAYVASRDGDTDLYVRWMDSGQTARLAQLPGSPRSLAWSPDGKQIAFLMRVESGSQSRIEMPERPEGAEWAKSPRYIDELLYRSDGAGIVSEGYTHVFVVPADGGTPRQVTNGDFNHEGPVNWLPDGSGLVFSGNRHDDWRYDPLNSEIYRLDMTSGEIVALTDRQGPDGSPVLSPDGGKIAYLGFEDAYQGYQVTRLNVMNADGSESATITGDLDRSINAVQWRSNGRGLFVSYDDEGITRLARVDLDGDMDRLAEHLGGESIGRPYGGESFSVSDDDAVAFNVTSPEYPADVAVLNRGDIKRLTALNDDLLPHRDLAEVEEIRFESSHDEKEIQGWIAKPPGFDPEKQYPMILEIHGGPFANYGPRFSTEVQLYASAGYVVLYINPRGSTSYGEAFGNAIHHAYPGHDYDDLMSGVDALLDRGYVDSERLYVTGGSGGGVLSAWIVGHTDRFRAAVVAKPVINWYSFALTADFYNFFHKYWFPGLPWENLEHYMKRSPISYAGQVVTPTMVLTGEEDYRTPMSESEQFYQALKLEKVDAALVRVPGASHHIAERPSQLIAKALYVLYWFESHPPADNE